MLNFIKLTYLLLALTAFFLCGCLSFNSKRTVLQGRNSNKDRKTLTYKTKEYFLSKTPNYLVEQDFQKIVEDSFLSVFQNIDFDIKKSFSYIITPQGASYPFSRVEVSCLVRDDLDNARAAGVCNIFFNSIDRKYEVLKKEIPE